MAKYTLFNLAGRDLGTWEAEDEDHAILLMCKEAGYRNAQEAFDKRFFHPDRVIAKLAVEA